MDGSIDSKNQKMNSQPDQPAHEPPKVKPNPRLVVKKLPKPSKKANDTSAIGFPYHDLETAVAVARSMIEAGGVPLTRDQLAGAMKLAAGSGNFVLRVGTARMFGLIENKDGKYQLTQLGFSIVDVDEKRKSAARAEAFLNVPLYRRAYEEFRGKQLPPRPHGLEQAFVQFGVPPKQKDKARQAFDRSARQGGFFVHGEDRLVEPIIGASAPAPPPGLRPSDRSPAGRSYERELSRARSYHPFIEGLLEELPEARTVWKQPDREKWLRTAADIFELIYKKEETAPPSAGAEGLSSAPAGDVSKRSHGTIEPARE